MRTKQRRWIGIDGEGVGRRPHRYVMMCTSDGDVIEDRKGLGTQACLELLLSLGTRDARVCGYYLSYDWTMILGELPDRKLYQLLRPELRATDDGSNFIRIKWRGYHLHYLSGAMWISHPRTKRRVTVWDLGKYYQCTFVEALKLWKIGTDVQESIAKMKQRRSAFTWRDRVSIRKYCQAECVALAELATALEQAHVDANVAPRAWHGPGSTAGALLRRYEIHEKRGAHPPAVVQAAEISYFGGRAEIGCSGRIDRPVYGYDISSAYPYHSSGLPCLEHGQWETIAKEKDLTRGDVVQAMVFGSIESSKGDWGPLPVRKRDGSIIFPLDNASGCWWLPEWQAARRGWIGLRFERAIVLRKCCVCRPFAFVPELFDHRLAVGKETGEGRVIKLALNSLYGKLAQRLHGKFSSRLWAGMITAGTRAQVLDLITAHDRQDSVLMVATDGVFSTELLDVPANVRLGGWERAEFTSGMTLARPGIYWTPGGKLRARGLGRDTLDRVQVMLAEALEASADRVVLPSRTVFGGAKLCVYRTKTGSTKRAIEYGQWHQIPTRLSLSPAPKRTADWSPPRPDEHVFSHPFGAGRAIETGLLVQILEEIQQLSL